ncbi:MAG: hypothetical protein A2172_01750 [Candidatus Woykebacteria bacterium RBG_13_40_15]|uniref:Single cache domain-containing protein n=1 Tax=Candidatus Woykebacteria bacterium RBG_13_40_15 TaxID=1802593 RepID=A0A1G1W9S8_9BACT|nr:MAG: hypothetical protein A2172_01750 [Candidatus Woykebacteria bacterium RBG_13_40_15]
MLPIEFFGQNFHFALNLFAALVFFAISWLYFDAWLVHREKKEIFKWSGFLLLSISFVIHATVIEQSVLGPSIFGDKTEIFTIVFRAFGYLSIIFGQIIDPLQPVPETKGLKLKKEKGKPAALAVLTNFQTFSPLSKILLPFGSLLSGLLYARRVIVGLERHLKPVVFGFLFLTIFEALSLATFFQNSTNPIIFDLVRSFGPVWGVEHLTLLISIVIFGKWGWSYLVTRLQSQLFMIFSTVTLLVFLLTTVSFTFLLMRNVEQESLANLETAANVLDYALVSKRAEISATAESLAANSAAASALMMGDHKSLSTLSEKFIEEKKLPSLIFTDPFGKVIARGEDTDRWGDSISSDPLVKRALIGEASTGVVTREDVLSPVIFIKSAVPVRDSNKNIVGAVLAGLLIDNSFVDGVKNATGLDSAVYAGNVRSATTFLAPDGKHRYIGVKEENPQVKQEVLKEGKTFKGSLNVLNRPLLAVYAPLKDVDNSIVGMLFIGKPLTSILQTAGRSIELTFLVAAVLLVISIIPAYFIAKYLTNQLK